MPIDLDVGRIGFEFAALPTIVAAWLGEILRLGRYFEDDGAASVVKSLDS